MRSLLRLAMVLGVSAGLCVAQALAAPPQVLAWEAAVYGKDSSSLKWPVDLASAATGELVVVDLEPPRLVVFREATDGSWASQRVVELPEAPASLIAGDGAYFLSLRPSGGLYSVDRETWKPRRLPLPQGVMAGRLGHAGDGGILALDDGSGDVLRVSEEGSVVSRTPVQGPAVAVEGGPGGALFTLDPVAAEVRPAGEGASGRAPHSLEGEAGDPPWPIDMAATSTGSLYVLDRHRGRVFLLDGTGALAGVGARRGREPGLLWYPAALALMPDGRLAIADQGNGRAQIYRRIEEPGR
jgi:outer membrane protein assembly factor BamB